MKIINYQIIKIIFVPIFICSLIGCEAKISSHGKILETHDIDKLKIGKTDVHEVINILGKPSFMGAFGSRKFYYDRYIIQKDVASKSSISKRDLYILSFDQNNILESISLNNEASDIKVSKIKEKTPTPGDKITVIEQVFSNLKRK